MTTKKEVAVKKEKFEVNFRELVGDDIFYASKILDAIDLKIDFDKVESMKNDKENTADDYTEFGYKMFYGVVRNLHKAKSEVNEFLSSLSGIPADKIGKLPLVKYAELIKKLKELKGIIEVFKSAGQ